MTINRGKEVSSSFSILIRFSSIVTIVKHDVFQKIFDQRNWTKISINLALYVPLSFFCKNLFGWYDFLRIIGQKKNDLWESRLLISLPLVLM